MTRIEGEQSAPLKEQELSKPSNKALQASWYLPPDVTYPTSFTMPGKRQITDETKGKQEAVEPTKPAQLTLTRAQIFSIKGAPHNNALVMKFKNKFRKSPNLQQVNISPSEAKKLGL